MQAIQKVRFLLSEQCNANCKYCFNKDMRIKKHMDTKKAKLLIDFFSEYVPDIKVMGGEPTLHPDFIELYKYAQKKFISVGLFTNAINKKLFKIKPRERDNVVYNMGFVNKNFDFSKFLLDKDFGRHLEVMVGSDTNTDELISNIKLIEEKTKKIKDTVRYNITLNCVEDIFVHEKKINDNWRKVVNFIHKIHPEALAFDHTVPLCFWDKESRKLVKNIRKEKEVYATCRPGCFSLIDSSFNLLHCNQYPVKITSLFRKEGKKESIIDFKEFYFSLYKANMKKKQICLTKEKCKNCKFAEKYCTGGCLMHKCDSIK